MMRALAGQHALVTGGGARSAVQLPNAAAVTAGVTRKRPDDSRGRFITSEEVAQSLLWLCLPTSSAITGQGISVSGGEI